MLLSEGAASLDVTNHRDSACAWNTQRVVCYNLARGVAPEKVNYKLIEDIKDVNIACRGSCSWFAWWRAVLYDASLCDRCSRGHVEAAFYAASLCDRRSRGHGEGFHPKHYQDGMIFSGKYDPELKTTNQHVHVFVFANQEPNVMRLSPDRWNIIRNLGDDQTLHQLFPPHLFPELLAFPDPFGTRPRPCGNVLALDSNGVAHTGLTLEDAFMGDAPDMEVEPPAGGPGDVHMEPPPAPPVSPLKRKCPFDDAEADMWECDFPTYEFEEDPYADVPPFMFGAHSSSSSGGA